MTSSASPLRVALLGYGTVGRSLHELLLEHAAHIAHATGREVEVVAALVTDAGRARDLAADLPLVESLGEVLALQPDLVCEAMGGLEPARSHVLAVLEQGIPVATANKQLVAHHGAELFAAAERCDVQLRFEASVCGAIPIIKMLRESMVAARIDCVLGILNGTTNYMLTAMTTAGWTYDEALARAQELGYAEADPSDDVGGADAAAKLALLAGIAFHTRVPIEAVRTVGMQHLSAADIAFARQLGYQIKMIGRAEIVSGSLSLDVTPMLVPNQHPLAAVTGSTNAVQVTGSAFDELMIQGPGAGGSQTASALAADIVSVLGSSPSFLTRDPYLRDLALAGPEAREERFYVRTRVQDKPGVLAAVAHRFADQAISIERVIQQRSDDDTASLVITTHPTTAAAIGAALTDDVGLERSVLPMLEVPTA